MGEVYTNAEKLAAVVEYWAGPRLRQVLPGWGNLLTSAVRPAVLHWAQMVPDESIPATAAEMVQHAKEEGGLRLWRLEIDRDDLCELERLLRVNMPCDEQPHRGYEVRSE